MKRIFTTLALAIFIAGAFAQLPLLQTKVSVTFSNAPLEQILSYLSETYTIEFSYGRDNIALDKIATISKTDVSLDLLLKELLNPAGISYAVIGQQIVLRKSESATKHSNKKAFRKISGTIVDRVVGNPLPYATISLKGKALGTISNPTGEFSFVLNSVPGDTIVISYLGYAPYMIPLDTLRNNYIRIELHPQATVLKEVEIRAQSARSILEAALSRIPQNYWMEPFRQSFYLRDRTWRDGEPIKASESIYEAYRGSMHQKEYRKQVKLIQGRKSAYNQKYFEILKALPMLNSFDVGMTAYAIFNVDMARFDHHEVFFGKGNMKHYNFELLDNTVYNGREVYVIAFDQKDVNKSLLTGRLYIDVESMAIIHISQSLSPKGIEHAEIFGPKVLEKIMGLGENVVGNVSQEIHFREHRGKWFVDYLNLKQEISLIKKKRKFNAYITSESTLVVTDIVTDSIQAFAESEITAARNLAYRQYGETNEDFWESQNYIKPDQAFQDSFERIQSKNLKNEKTVDDVIWSRMNRKRRKGKNQAPLDSVARESTIKSAEENENKSADWLESDLAERKETKRYRIHYNYTDTGVVDDVINTLDKHYSRILKDYKIKKLPKIEIFIYPSIDDYHSAINYPNAPSWMIGSATIDKFSIVSPQNAAPSFSYAEVLKGVVHEFMHCVHIHLAKNNLGKARNNDGRWLWESLACYEGNQFVDPKSLNYVVNDNFPSIEDLNSVDQQEKIYELGFVITEFIKFEWGMQGLIRLIKSNADVKETFRVSEDEFQKKLKVYIQAKYL